MCFGHAVLSGELGSFVIDEARNNFRFNLEDCRFLRLRPDRLRWNGQEADNMALSYIAEFKVVGYNQNNSS